MPMIDVLTKYSITYVCGLLANTESLPLLIKNTLLSHDLLLLVYHFSVLSSYT